MATCTSKNFGIKGTGRLYIYRNNLIISTVDTPDAIYDCSWSETKSDSIVLACANGTILLYNYESGTTMAFKKEHLRESSCVDWNLIDREQFLSASWDGTIKIWNHHSPSSISTYHHGNGNVYQASWMPSNPNLFISSGSDCAIHLWDRRVESRGGSSSSSSSQSIFQAHTNEILSIDWNKYDQFQFISGSSDCALKIWDWKFVGIGNPIDFAPKPLHVLNGHQRAVRKVKCNPWNRSQFISAGYDMTIRCWDVSMINPLDRTIDDHTEFVIGLDYNLHERNVFASCSWDDTIRIYKQ